MPIDSRIIKQYCPCLVLDSKEPEKPVDVEKVLDAASLNRGEGFQTLIEKVDLDSATIAAAFKNFCDSESGLYLKWNLLNKTAGIEETVQKGVLEEILKLSTDSPAYYTVVESTSEIGESRSEYKKLMADKYIISYAFYFPSQNGYAYDAAPASNEGRWSAFTLLMDKATDKPLYAGFHKTGGVKVLSVAGNDLTGGDNRFDCYVSLGCHSFFEAPGKYEFRYNSGIDVISAALEAEDDPNRATLCVENGGTKTCQGVSDGDAFIGVIVIILVAIFGGLSKAKADEDDKEPAPEPLEDMENEVEIVPAEEDEEEVEVEVTDVILYETADGKGEKVCTSKLIDAKNKTWWKEKDLKWGDQDVEGEGLERFGKGTKRPNFVAEFLDYLAGMG